MSWRLGSAVIQTLPSSCRVICEELGLAGGALVVAIYMIMLWAGLSIIRESKDSFAKLAALGIMITLGLQALFNIAVVTVMVPTKGIPLPLISSGGTGWVVTAAAVVFPPSAARRPLTVSWRKQTAFALRFPS